MKLTETLVKLLEEHARQVKNPSLWQDNAWKGTYYSYYNKVYDVLEQYDLGQETYEPGMAASLLSRLKRRVPSPWRR